MVRIVDVSRSVPGLPEPFVPRPRLLAALDDAGGDRTVLVCAPAGFGKTSLLAHWTRSAEAAGTAVAWADVHRSDDDPSRFWVTVLNAVRACRVVPADSRLHELCRLAPSSWATSGFVTDVIRAVEALPARITLVLHDVHELVAPATLKGLESLLLARSARLRLLVCSRSDPPLSLGQLRSAGRLREIRADQLRFTVDEAGALLRRSGLRLTPSQVSEVHGGTRGWPEGMRLGGAALRGGADPQEFLQRLTTNTRPMAAFLVGELVATLPKADRKALSAISIGGPVPAELAAVLTGRPDAGPLLDRLARETGLVVPVRAPAAPFSIRPLVAALLRGEDSMRTEEHSELHARAARWWMAHGDPVAATAQAIRAADDRLLVELVHRCAAALLVTGYHLELRRALSAVGERVVAGDPWLTLCSALLRIESGDATGAEADLRRAGELFPAEPDSRLAVLRSIAQLFDLASSADLTADPQPLGEERRGFDAPEWNALALVSVGGRALLAHAAPVAASAALEDALELTRRHGFRYLEMQCLALLAGVAGVAGDYRAMTAAANGALRVAATRGWDRSPWSATARWMLAYSALMRAQPAEARRYASEGLRRGGTALRPRLVSALRAVHGAALFDSGRRHEGLQQMQQARTDLGGVPLSAEQAAVLAVLEHHAAVVLDRPVDARTVVDWLSDRIGRPGEVLLMQAWEKLSVGRSNAARADVEPILAGAVPSVLPHTLVEALLVAVSVDVSGGQVHTARNALRAALSSGASLEVVRPFALAEAEARELLGSHVTHSGSTEPFAVRALAAGRSHERPTADLDAAERQVIALLSSPLSVEQIADELDIPIDEAQARLRMIYRKLGVSSRRTAVTAASERGIRR
ncbi:LuxR family maltose regulon positive regulatory protein [Pseudonocardia cypriaca]|uniref:LuxR family maltose regulon positive regulatory protein n=1 Tax=Pseudonocardia cypriaca TaxID=882449 RepID=A0A543GFS4_9PSEU|nr:LuxR family maltose regulon positive regulatory protein [Pseudonocardia cypriaca]